MGFIKKIASNTFYQILSRLASSSAGFIIAIIIARFFGIEGYGNYAKVTAFVGIFYLFVDFGFNAVFLQQNNQSKKAKEFFLTRFIFSLVVFSIVILLAFFLPYNSKTMTGFSPLTVLGIVIFSLTLISEGIVYSATAVFQKTLSYKNLMFSTVSGSVVTLLSVSLSIFFSLPIISVFVSFVLGSSVKAFVAIRLSRVDLVSPASDQKKFSLDLIKQSLPVALMLIFNMIYFRIDTIILSVFVRNQDVAVYDYACKFFDFLIAIPLYLSNTLYPSFIEKAKNQKLSFAKTLEMLGYFFVVSLIFVIPVILFAPFISIIKQEFFPSILVLRILTLSLPVFFATSLLQWILLAHKKQNFLAGVYLVGALLNIFLNLVFIPKYSYIASSVITGVSEVFIFVVLFIKLLNNNYGRK